MKSIIDRAKAAYLGVAIGDALGATVEFMIPNEIKSAYGVHKEIIGGGWLKLKAGRVTDDTEMSLALGEALLSKGAMDAHTVATSFLDWMRSKPVDIGGTVRRGLVRFSLTGETVAEPSERSAGNGAAMRNLPVIIATLGDNQRLMEWTSIQGRITHNNEESDRGSYIIGLLTSLSILMGGEAPLHATARRLMEETPAFDYTRFKPIDTDGYIVHTVRTVLHSFFSTGDFEACIVKTVNYGGDADTNGAIAGMLAGAFYGVESIPGRWLRRLDPNVKEAVERQVDILLETFPPRRAPDPDGAATCPRPFWPLP
ncbi:MAG: ADP-ribosyl-[dinitrogen reductase] hydrolase [Deltaproteobacteria bacterium]|nr:ADP-ribosyl-[dinitrogen reductase] hydrolase [Deltaproteobacteria bacterium]